MDIRGESGFAKFLSLDDYIKLLSKKPKRRVELPEGWRNVIEEYYKVIICYRFIHHLQQLLILLFYRKQLKVGR